MKYKEVLYKLANDPSFASDGFMYPGDTSAVYAPSIQPPSPAKTPQGPAQAEWLPNAQQWYTDYKNSDRYKQQKEQVENNKLPNFSTFSLGLGAGAPISTYNVPHYYNSPTTYNPDNIQMSWGAQANTPYESYVLYGRRPFTDDTPQARDRRAMYDMVFNKSLKPEEQNNGHYWTADEVELLKRVANQYGLEGAELFDNYTTDALVNTLNGTIGPDMPEVRWAAHRVNPMFTAATAIHDLRFNDPIGTEEDWKDANEQLYRNMAKLNDADNYPGSPMHSQVKNNNIKMYERGLGSKSFPVYRANARMSSPVNVGTGVGLNDMVTTDPYVGLPEERKPDIVQSTSSIG